MVLTGVPGWAEMILVTLSCAIPLLLAVGAGVLVWRWAQQHEVVNRETRCRKCGGILRGLAEPRCPECGEVI